MAATYSSATGAVSTKKHAATASHASRWSRYTSRNSPAAMEKSTGASQGGAPWSSASSRPSKRRPSAVATAASSSSIRPI